jgi:hypothetical protein
MAIPASSYGIGIAGNAKKADTAYIRRIIVRSVAL